MRLASFRALRIMHRTSVGVDARVYGVFPTHELRYRTVEITQAYKKSQRWITACLSEVCFVEYESFSNDCNIFCTSNSNLHLQEMFTIS